MTKDMSGPSSGVSKKVRGDLPKGPASNVVNAPTPTKSTRAPVTKAPTKVPNQIPAKPMLPVRVSLMSYKLGNVPIAVNALLENILLNGAEPRHYALRIDDIEYSFAGIHPSGQGGGIVRDLLRSNRDHVFLEETPLGWCDLEAANHLLDAMTESKSWRGASYNIFYRSCISFVQEFARHLGFGKILPKEVLKLDEALRRLGDGLADWNLVTKPEALPLNYEKIPTSPRR